MFTCATHVNGNGEALEFGSSEELASLTIERANEKSLREDDLYPIEATDPAYSEPVFARAVGRRIVGIRVLRFEVRSTPTRVMSPALEDRPREAGVVLELEDGSALLISHTMLDAPNNLGIFPAEQLVNTDLSFKEVLHLRAEPAKIVRDVLDSRGGIIGALAILTDGTSGWRMPDHVDLSAVQLV